MTVSIPALIAEEFPIDDDSMVLAKIVLGYWPGELNQPTAAHWLDWAKALASADRILAAGFRRPSPVTREALADTLVRSLSDLSTGPLSDTPYKYAEVNDDGQLELFESLGDWPLAAIDVPQLADAILSRFSLPEPAEEVATQYRAVWPGGSVSMPLPSRVPLDELFESGDSPRPVGIERRTARYGVWVPVKGTEQ